VNSVENIPLISSRIALIIFLYTALCVGCTHAPKQPVVSLVERPEEFKAFRPEQLRWVPGRAKGGSLAVLWGEPEKNLAGGVLYRFDAGFESPPHAHPFTERAIVIFGSFIVTAPNGEQYRLTRGSLLVIQRGVVHATRCESAEGCEVYSEVIPESGEK
jgi:quercetin dioxygenase-like cupin family protein